MTVFEANNTISKIKQPGQKKYAMYLRKSRVDLELEAISKEETLERHRKLLFSLAERKGILPSQITIYHEMVSGDSIDDRPEMQRLLQDVYKGMFDGVLVTEIERLARGNTKDQGEVADAFTFSNTLIITPAKDYDPNNEFDQEYFEFGLFMSRREYKTIRRRLETGKWQSVREGNYLPPEPPFGFDVVRKSKKERYLVENPDESKYVKMIFDWYTEDRKPTFWIAKQLTAMGVPTRRKGRDWARATIKDILFNAHYIGKVSWGHQQTIKEKDPITGKVSKKRKSTGNIQYFDGKHKGFISEEQFYKVRKFYGANAPAKLNTELANPLSGILVCHCCGRAIGYQSYPDNRISRYFHPRGRYTCKMKSIYSEVVVEAIINSLKDYIQDFEIKVENGNENSEAERHQQAIEAMESELAKQEKMKKRLFDSWEADDGTYTRDEFLERKQMYVHTIETIQSEISRMKNESPKPIDFQQKISDIHAIIDCISDSSISAKEKNLFLKGFIEKITLDTIDLGAAKGAKPVLDIYFK